MSLSFRIVLGFVFLFQLIFFSSIASAQTKDPDFYTQVSESKLRALEISGLAFASAGQKQQVLISLPTHLGSKKIDFLPHDIRAAGFISSVVTDQGSQPDPTRVLLFKYQDKSDFARLALLQDGTGQGTLRGFLKEGARYYAFGSEHKNSSNIAVREVDKHTIDQVILRCGLETGSLQLSPSRKNLNNITSVSGEEREATILELEVGTEADFEYHSALSSAGSSANAEILAILNSVDGIYQNQLGIGVRVSFQNAWTVPADPYSGDIASLLLDQFATYWNSNFSSSRRYDVATMFSGKEFLGSTAGIAYLEAACSSFRYGLVQHFSDLNFSIPVVAHEIGHNLGADHDDCSGGQQFLMCPSLVPGAQTFSPASSSEISSYLSTVSCLASVDDGSGTTGGDSSTGASSGSGGTGTSGATGGGTAGDGGAATTGGGTTGGTTGGGSTGGGSRNSPPVFNPIGNKTVAENSNLSFSISAVDPDSPIISFSATDLPAGATFAGDTFSWTPGFDVVNQQNSASFPVTFLAVDSGGASDSATVIVTVSNVNRPPQLGNLSNFSGSEGSLLEFDLPVTDPDSDPLSFVVSGLPAGASVNSTTGTVSWLPARGQTGSFSLSFSASDPFGEAVNGSFLISITAVSGVAALPSSFIAGDIDADGKAELGIYRPLSGEWFSTDAAPGGVLSSIPLGRASSVTLVGDYNGDRISDFAAFNPETREWSFRMSRSLAEDFVTFGNLGDLPVSGDFDGDGRDDIAVFSPQAGSLSYLESSSGNTSSLSLGSAGDIPVPCDYDGDGKDEFAVFNLAGGLWQSQSSSDVQLGLGTDIPVPADFNGDGSCQRAVWRPATGEWFIEGQAAPIQFGLGGDIPTTLDLDGDGVSELAVFRPESGTWYLRDGNAVASIQFGLSWDMPVSASAKYFAFRNSNGVKADDLMGSATQGSVFNSAENVLVSTSLTGTRVKSIAAVPGSSILRGDYTGDGSLDDVVFNAGIWSIYPGAESLAGQVETKFWGQAGDVPVSADFDGDGVSDLAIWRPADGGWYIVHSRSGAFAFYQWGLSGDIPVPADFNGDGWADPAVWRPSGGFWFVLDSRSARPIEFEQWGLPGDIPRVVDFDRDGRADKVVWRPNGGFWFSLNSGGGLSFAQWGLPGDQPVPGRYFSPNQTDFSVYRPGDGNFYIRSLTGNVRVLGTGQANIGQVVQTNPVVPLL